MVITLIIFLYLILGAITFIGCYIYDLKKFGKKEVERIDGYGALFFACLAFWPALALFGLFQLIFYLVKKLAFKIYYKYFYNTHEL